MDPTGSGRFSSKLFVELVSHENLSYMTKYDINLSIVLHGIFEAFESQLIYSKNQVTKEIIEEHSQVTPQTSLSERLQDQGQFVGLMGAMIGPQPEKER